MQPKLDQVLYKYSVGIKKYLELSFNNSYTDTHANMSVYVSVIIFCFPNHSPKTISWDENNLILKEMQLSFNIDNI